MDKWRDHFMELLGGTEEKTIREEVEIERTERRKLKR